MFSISQAMPTELSLGSRLFYDADNFTDAKQHHQSNKGKTAFTEM